MRLSEFKEVQRIVTTTPDSVEQIAWLICAAYSKTPEQVNKFSALKFLLYSERIRRKLEQGPRLFGVKLQTDAARITFGQFIEVQHWLKQSNGEDVAPVIELIAASILKKPAKDHAAAAVKMLDKHFAGIVKQVAAFIESQNALIKSYSGLFDKTEETATDEELRPKEKEHPFVERYGWIFAAEDIAKLKGVTLDKVYDMPVIEAFNYMAYLKAKGEFIKWQAKK